MAAVPLVLPIAVTAVAVAAIDYLVRHYIHRPRECPGIIYIGCSDMSTAINNIESELGGVISEKYDQPQRKTTILK